MPDANGKEVRVVAASAVLGSGFVESSFEHCLTFDPHFIGCDAGTTDAGLQDAGPDAGLDDAGIDDAGSDADPEAGPPDAGFDAGAADAGVDAGAADAGLAGGVCGNDAGEPGEECDGQAGCSPDRCVWGELVCVNDAGDCYRPIDPVVHDFQTRADPSEGDNTTPHFWDIVCAELCGNSHTAMSGRLYVVSNDEYEKWISGQETSLEVPLQPYYADDTKQIFSYWHLQDDRRSLARGMRRRGRNKHHCRQQRKQSAGGNPAFMKPPSEI